MNRRRKMKRIPPSFWGISWWFKKDDHWYYATNGVWQRSGRPPVIIPVDGVNAVYNPQLRISEPIPASDFGVWKRGPFLELRHR